MVALGVKQYLTLTLFLTKQIICQMFSLLFGKKRWVKAFLLYKTQTFMLASTTFIQQQSLLKMCILYVSDV